VKEKIDAVVRSDEKDLEKISKKGKEKIFLEKLMQSYRLD
jgi:hypothetical protein